jgi:hypothetical protein
MQVGTDAAFFVPVIEKPPHCCGVETTMPTFRKVDSIAIEPKSLPLSKRFQVAQEYDAYLASFAVGDYGRATLFDGERRALVRQRLQAAARRRGLALRFRSGPGPLTFRVTAAPEMRPSPPHAPVEAAPVIAPVTDGRLQRPPRPPRRQTATERYHDLLPRWMRAGQHGSRPNGIPKRRPR